MSTHTALLLRHLRQLLPRPIADPTGDEALLSRFLAQDDQEAFAVLVARHGPMVLAVCRRLLADPHAVEDAFQATFLALARHARSVRRPGALAAWLHQVARRAALEACATLARHRFPTPAGPGPADPHPDPLAEVSGRELLALIDEEIQGLPQAYRLPLILCCLEGRPQEEAARLLGWSPGAVKGRLERGRALLHARLSRRGLEPLAALPGLLPGPAPLAADLLGATLRATAPDGMARAGATALAAALARGGAVRFVAPALLILAAGLLAAGLTTLGPAALPLPQTSTNALRAARNGPAKEAATPADPLPAGAIIRLGTIRLRHATTVGAVLFSPDGKTLASAADDRTVIVWDATTGKPLSSFGFPRGGDSFTLFDRLAFDPKGKFLAVGRQNDILSGQHGQFWKVQLIDIATGKVVRGLWAKGAGSIQSIAISSDGRTLAASDTEGAILVWDLAGKCEKFKVDLPADRSYLLCFTPDGKTLVLADHRQRQPGSRPLPAHVHLWDVASGKKRRSFPVDTKYGVTALAMRRDGDTLAVAASKRASLWQLSTGKKLRPLMPRADVRSVAFSPDGKTAALGLNRPEGGLVCLVDPDTGKKRLQFDTFATSLSFSSDGQRLATVGGDCAVHVWDVRTGRHALPVGGPTGAARALGFSPDGKTLVTGEDGGTVRIWDVRTGVERSARRLRISYGQYAGFGSVRVLQDGRLLVTPNDSPHGPPGAPKSPFVWDARTGKVVVSATPLDNRGGSWFVCPVEVSPDGKTAAWADKNEVILIEVATGLLRRRLKVNEQNVCFIRFCRDGRRLATVSYPDKGEPVLCVWDAVTGKRLAHIQDRSVNAFALSPDGRTIATAGSSSVVHFWDADSGAQLRQTIAGAFNALAFSPDGTFLVLAAGDQVSLRDVATASELLVLKGHRGGVCSLVFADSRRLASAGWDTTVLVWDLAAAVRGTSSDTAPSKRDLDAAWSDLGGTDPKTVFRAAMVFRVAPAKTIDLLREQVRPSQVVAAMRLAKLVKDLDNDDFAVRQEASGQLERLGSPAESALREALRTTRSLEVKRRAGKLLAVIVPQGRRMLRVVGLLEEANTPRARALLQALSRGNPAAEETKAARAALKRQVERP